MATIIEPIHLVAAKEAELLATPRTFIPSEDAGLPAGSLYVDFSDIDIAAASSDYEQVVATIAPPIQSHVVAQIPAVDYNVDAPTAPKIINHQVLSSKIVNPA